jgi:hypothetical protein
MFITATCTIRQQTIFRSGEKVFQQQKASFDDFLISAYESLQPNYPKFYKMDRLSKLGFLATEFLLQAADIRHYPAHTVNLVLSNANSSLDADIKYQESTRTSPSPAMFVYTLPNIVAGEISIRHHLKGENAFFITPQFDAPLIAGYAAQVVSQPAMEGCVAGWIDTLGTHHDVFLYLAEKSKRGLGLEHTTEQLTALYNAELWNS